MDPFLKPVYYISGKITDPDKEKYLANLEKFNQKEKELVAKGKNVFNPVWREKDGRTWEEYMAYDVLFIMQQRPIMYMMTDWKQSKGSRLEHELAILLRLRIVYE